MTERIVIEGQMVRHIRETVISEAPMERLKDSLIEYRAATYPVLPTNATRFMEFDPNSGNGVILVERPPQKHHIRVKHHENSEYNIDGARRDAEGIGVWHVQLPYTYWLFPFTATRSNERIGNFTVRNTTMLFRREPYRTPEDRFHYAAVPNVDIYGGICWGGTVRPQASFSEHIDALVNEFFITTFNEDLGHRTPFDQSLTDWENASEAPLSWNDWDLWSESDGVTLEDLRDRWTEPGFRDVSRDLADLNPAFVSMPAIPENFTILRAMQWLQSLPEGTRFRVEAAMQQLAEDARLVTEEEIAEAEA